MAIFPDFLTIRQHSSSNFIARSNGFHRHSIVACLILNTQVMMGKWVKRIMGATYTHQNKQGDQDGLVIHRLSLELSCLDEISSL
jgi:hypothetical protein